MPGACILANVTVTHPTREAAQAFHECQAREGLAAVRTVLIDRA